jgi:hypothetical protein
MCWLRSHFGIKHDMQIEALHFEAHLTKSQLKPDLTHFGGNLMPQQRPSFIQMLTTNTDAKAKDRIYLLVHLPDIDLNI